MQGAREHTPNLAGIRIAEFHVFLINLAPAQKPTGQNIKM